MTTPAFKHFDLSLLQPAFDSPLVDVLTELEHLRRLQLLGTTPAPLFLQLKGIFHMLESLSSARIEGNHTTLADYVESKLVAAPQSQSDALREMNNIENAMQYIEAHITPQCDVSEHFIRELHALTVQGLMREGDATPGAYRRSAVSIAQSAHLPPEFIAVPQYMRELVTFINAPDARKYDLIKVALAHHRFGWVHPFGNGNGRVVRLLTYALLIKYGFNVKANERVLNPTAVFCNDRDRYYAMLAVADTGSPQGLEAWCVYVLDGVLEELRKVDKLTDFVYLRQHILLPALDHAKERQLITPLEARILHIAVQAGAVKAADLSAAMPGLSPTQRTYQIKKLVEKNMLQAIEPNARQYTIGFSHSTLMRGIVRALTAQGFIAPTLNSGI